MSLSIGADRSTLISEARHDWLQQQQSKALLAGESSQIYTPPTNAQLIAEDAQLKEELAKLEAASEQLAELAATAQTSYTSSGSSATSGSGSSSGQLNVFA